jgi:hypothetical protein
MGDSHHHDITNGRRSANANRTGWEKARCRISKALGVRMLESFSDFAAMVFARIGDADPRHITVPPFGMLTTRRMPSFHPSYARPERLADYRLVERPAA